MIVINIQAQPLWDSGMRVYYVYSVIQTLSLSLTLCLQKLIELLTEGPYIVYVGGYVNLQRAALQGEVL